jgi:hypothetical protein
MGMNHISAKFIHQRCPNYGKKLQSFAAACEQRARNEKLYPHQKRYQRISKNKLLFQQLDKQHKSNN